MNSRLPRLLLALALVLTLMDRGVANPAGERGASRALPIAAPLNSGACGVCGNGRCFGPVSPYRCVRLFDPGQGAIIRNLTCDQAGLFRAPLAPGQYALDRTGAGYPLKNVKGAETIEVKAAHWTRLDGLNAEQCPDSGVYGWDYRPCSGAVLAGSYPCVTVVDPAKHRVIGSVSCEMAYPTFNLPLPPGRYLVKLAHWPQQTVDIETGRWTRMGLTEAAPCPPIP